MKKDNYAFIDSQNLHKGVQELGWALDYLKFRNYLRTKYRVINTSLFIGYIPSNSGLYEMLRKFGYILVFKQVLEIRSQSGKISYKGNVDAELVLFSVTKISEYDKAVIVSGDGDFLCLADYLEHEGKLEKILTPNKKYSSLLKKHSNRILPVKIDSLRKKLSLQS